RRAASVGSVSGDGAARRRPAALQQASRQSLVPTDVVSASWLLPLLANAIPSLLRLSSRPPRLRQRPALGRNELAGTDIYLHAHLVIRRTPERIPDVAALRRTLRLLSQTPAALPFAHAQPGQPVIRKPGCSPFRLLGCPAPGRRLCRGSGPQRRRP